SHFQASGQLKDFDHPTIDLTYQALLDLKQVGYTLRAGELRNGDLEFAGRGTYSLQGFSTAGRVSIKNLEYAEARAKLSGASAAATYDLPPRTLTLRDLDLRLLGGSVTGGGAVQEWQTAFSESKSEQAKQSGNGRFVVKGMQLATISRALASR